MYFKYFKSFDYNFGSTAEVSYEVKDIFSRAVIKTDAIDILRINNDQSPDQTAQTLYDDNSSNVFAIELALRVLAPAAPPEVDFKFQLKLYFLFEDPK